MFRIGQRVVCVETWVDDVTTGYGDEKGPVEGQIYTIRAIGIGIHPAYPHTLDVLLNEIRNPVRQYKAGIYEPAFRATRFRPVVERKTDISIFTEILRKASKPARVPVVASPHHSMGE